MFHRNEVWLFTDTQWGDAAANKIWLYKAVHSKSNYSLGSLGETLIIQIPGPSHSWMPLDYLGVEPKALIVGYCEKRREIFHWTDKNYSW